MKNKIVKLREETGAGFMDCKTALVEANGDMEEAKKIIFKKGITKAEKKTTRKTGSGVLETYVHNGRIGVLLELRCETDFVAKNEEFKKLAHEIAMQIASINPNTVEELLEQNYIKDESIIIKDLINSAIGKLGENIQVERFCRYEL